jgi:hypothetical protein
MLAFKTIVCLPISNVSFRAVNSTTVNEADAFATAEVIVLPSIDNSISFPDKLSSLNANSNPVRL